MLIVVELIRILSSILVTRGIGHFPLFGVRDLSGLQVRLFYCLNKKTGRLNALEGRAVYGRTQKTSV